MVERTLRCAPSGFTHDLLFFLRDHHRYWLIFNPGKRNNQVTGGFTDAATIVCRVHHFINGFSRFVTVFLAILECYFHGAGDGIAVPRVGVVMPTCLTTAGYGDFQRFDHGFFGFWVAHGAAIIGDSLSFDSVCLKLAIVFFFMIRAGKEGCRANGQYQGKCKSEHGVLLDEVI